jgi:aspartate/methionine/tyrosine aminotransferase
MPQMKLGWIVINGPAPELDSACARLELILDTYLSVATPVQIALPELLRVGEGLQRDLKTRLSENLRSAHDLLAGSAAHPLHTEGGWSSIIQLPRVLSEQQWIEEMLERESMIVQPGFFFDMASEAYIVVSLITEPAVFAEGLARIRQVVERHCPN